MLSSSRGSRSLVLIASTDAVVASRLMEQVRRTGSVACVARSEHGCVRVATAAGPDLILLHLKLSSRLEALLRSHPVSAAARIVRVDH